MVQQVGARGAHAHLHTHTEARWCKALGSGAEWGALEGGGGGLYSSCWLEAEESVGGELVGKSGAAGGQGRQQKAGK